MPKKSKARSSRGPKRAAPKTARHDRPRIPAARPKGQRTQVRGGRPPRFPGRTGGR